ncbi:MAG: glycoside hydrolase family 88 protein [Chitinophagaceae bacterium]|nr:glycoside hydrolase family 88 protein [Chitinophagaceae bacterium]
MKTVKYKQNQFKLLRNFFTYIMFTCLNLLNVNAQSNKTSLSEIIDRNIKLAKTQYLYMTAKLPDQRMPRSYNVTGDSLTTSNTKWWCSGFYPGTLWYIYEYTKDTNILWAAEKSLSLLEPEKHYTGNHDLGFMMYCSFGNAYRISGNKAYKPTIDTAAISLISRYRPAIKSIQSWNKNQHFNCPVIIDNMMNLELLMWVARQNNNKELEEIAINHANSTLKYHFRKDNSSYHVLDYNLNNKEVIGKRTWQGISDSSAWSRGQAWGLYGFTMMYRFTKKQEYLNQANKIATFMLIHPNMPDDYIPYWDYNDPAIPATYRDASAAAIMASALLELGNYCNKKQKDYYKKIAEKIILNLSDSRYLNDACTYGGFLIRHSVGGLPQKSEIDVPLTYADYYFIEAMLRYKKYYL